MWRACIIVLMLLGCSSPNPPWRPVWKSDETFESLIDDPLDWSAKQFLDSERGQVEEARLESFETDIDHDGIGELFVTSETIKGQAGSGYLVFRKIQSKYRYIGCVGISGQRGFRVLAPSPEGNPQLRLWWRMGAGEGLVTTVCNDGKRFRVLHEEIVHAGDSGTEAGNRRFEEIFDPHSRSKSCPE